MRTFYLRIRKYAIGKNTPKFIICDGFATPPSHICDFFFNENKFEFLNNLINCSIKPEIKFNHN